MAKTKTRAVRPMTLMRTSVQMRAWLESKKPREVVTHNIMSNESCLMANFLTEKGCKDVLCGGSTVDVGRRRDYPLPGWFQRVFDDLDYNVGEGNPVTARAALAALDRVLKSA